MGDAICFQGDAIYYRRPLPGYNTAPVNMETTAKIGLFLIAAKSYIFIINP